MPLSPPCSKPIAPGVDLVETDEDVAVWLHGMVAFCWAVGDEAGRRLASVTLVSTKAATQRQVAEAFGANETTVWRWRAEPDRTGVAGLVGAPRGPKGAWKLTGELVERIVALDKQGLSGRQIARQVEVSDSSVRKVRAGRRRPTLQPEHVEGLAPAGPVADDTEDTDTTETAGLELLARPQPRTADRQAARAGLLAGRCVRVGSCRPRVRCWHCRRLPRRGCCRRSRPRSRTGRAVRRSTTSGRWCSPWRCRRYSVHLGRRG